MGLYVYEIDVPMIKRIRVLAKDMDHALAAVSETLGEDDEHAATVLHGLRGSTYAETDRMHARLVEIRENEQHFRTRDGAPGLHG